ncbi:MAG: phenylacetate--CoA ligase family protein [Lentimicrobium sp.]
MSLIENIYNNSPVFLQNVGCSIIGLKERQSRLGGKFNFYYSSLKKTEWFSEEQITTYQNKQISEIINYSYKNIPYYRELFSVNNINPNDIKSVEDLEKISILEKETVRNNFHKLQSINFNQKVIHSHTSGSTGKSLQFLMSIDAIQFRWALWFRHKSRFGISPNDPYATFTGKVAIPINQTRPPFWRENWPMNQTIFTMHHLSKEKVPFIVKRLNKGDFVYYTGYPSIIYNLAETIKELNLNITNPPKIIITGAESLLEFQVQLISEVFKCPVTDQYGFSEGCGNASSCEHGFYHEDFEYGVLECYNPQINDDGSITGEILATGFTNLAMPFIRYRVGDTATWVEKECECGRKSKIIREINGRTEDYVITPEGNKILRFDYIFKDTINVVEAQVVQKKLGEIIIRVVRRGDYKEKDENCIRREVHDKISPNLKVIFEYPLSIEREKTGKFRAVKSYIK